MSQILLFGERLKSLRDENGITQEALAKILNIQRVTISYYESGTRLPDSGVVLDIARYFGVSIDYLFGLSENKQHPDNAFPTPQSKENEAFISGIERALSYCFSLYELSNCKSMNVAINKFLSDLILIYTSAGKMLIDNKSFIDISTKLTEISTVSSSGMMRSLSFLNQSEAGANAGAEVNTASSFYGEYGGSKDGNRTEER